MADDLGELKRALASHKTEIEGLAGETLALQTILFWLLFHIQRNTPNPIEQALDIAANMVEDQAIAAARKSSPQHLAKALGIIEHFQKSIIPVRKK